MLWFFVVNTFILRLSKNETHLHGQDLKNIDEFLKKDILLTQF